jgi:hypothetical protein
MSKPSVFVGSSSEGLEVARAIGFQLEDAGEVTIWNEGTFPPSEGYLESLANSLDRFDFAVFVFTPDDAVTMRGETALAPRDNVMFELGLFLSRLGRDRTFVVRSSQPIKIASDLHGIAVLPYEANRSDRNLRAAVSAACVPIRDAIRTLGRVAAREQPTRKAPQLQSDRHRAESQLKAASGYRPVVDKTVSSFWHSYWRLATSHAPILGFLPPGEKPSEATFLYFRGTGLPKGMELVHKMEHGAVDLQLAGWGAKLDELRSIIGTYLRPDMTLRRAAKSAAVRLCVPPLTWAPPFPTRNQRSSPHWTPLSSS